MVTLERVTVAPWTLEAVFLAPEETRLMVGVSGLIGNSVPTSEQGRMRTADWKIAVAREAKSHRGPRPLDPRRAYAITLGFSFHPAAHGHRLLDIENFMKPTLDALAAGMFCPEDLDPSSIVRYDFDDSNFKYLFVQRLDDAPTTSAEGAALVVSCGA